VAVKKAIVVLPDQITPLCAGLPHLLEKRILNIFYQNNFLYQILRRQTVSNLTEHTA